MNQVCEQYTQDPVWRASLMLSLWPYRRSSRSNVFQFKKCNWFASPAMQPISPPLQYSPVSILAISEEIENSRAGRSVLNQTCSSFRVFFINLLAIFALFSSTLGDDVPHRVLFIILFSYLMDFILSLYRKSDSRYRSLIKSALAIVVSLLRLFLRRILI